MFLFPKRITRYVFFELVPPTMLGLFLYTFVLLMNHFFLVAEKALSKNLGADLTLRLFLVGIPELTVLSIPMSVLLGVMIVNGVFRDLPRLGSIRCGPARARAFMSG